MARLNITMDDDHQRLLDFIREEGESKSEVIRKAIEGLARERGYVIEYVPASLTVYKEER